MGVPSRALSGLLGCGREGPGFKPCVQVLEPVADASAAEADVRGAIPAPAAFFHRSGGESEEFARLLGGEKGGGGRGALHGFLRGQVGFTEVKLSPPRRWCGGH